jgi:flagellar biosynthesis/type III secretory pathway M-ring protein FliF/YscJ
VLNVNAFERDNPKEGKVWWCSCNTSIIIVVVAIVVAIIIIVIVIIIVIIVIISLLLKGASVCEHTSIPDI